MWFRGPAVFYGGQREWEQEAEKVPVGMMRAFEEQFVRVGREWKSDCTELRKLD